MSWLPVTFGALLLVFLTWDVLLTVFAPFGRSGPMTRRLYLTAWSLWRRLAPRRRPRHWLSLLGPLLVPVSLVAWITLLLLSFTLFFVPWAGEFRLGSEEVKDIPALLVALYYAGYSITTLGVGDIVPPGMPLRLLSVVASGAGLVLFTVTVTYLLSVYTALGRRTALALSIAQFLNWDDGFDAARAVREAALLDGGDEAHAWLRDAHLQLSWVTQAEGQFLLMHFFHAPVDRQALPVMLEPTLEFITVCRSLLCPDAYPSLTRGRAVQAAQQAAMGYLDACIELGEEVDEQVGAEVSEQQFQKWCAELERSGVRLREKHEAWRLYQGLVGNWRPVLKQVQREFGYRN